MLYDLDKRYLMPRALLELGTAAKMMWVYFNLTGAVKVSQRELGVELGLTQRAVGENLNKLSEAGFISYKPGQDRGDKSSIKALKTIFSPLDTPLPPLMREADASSKLLYLWLLPQGDVTYTHREVSAYLGMTEMTSVKARQTLESFGLLHYTQRPAPRQHGIYRVLKASELEEETSDAPALPKEIRGRGAELKLYWLIEQKGEVTAHQQTLAEILDAPQGAISKAMKTLLEHNLIERKAKKDGDVLVGKSAPVSKSQIKTVLPEKLKGETNAVQLLYMWLKPQGTVSYSHSDIVEHVQIRSYSVMMALNRLEDLGFLKVFEKATPHKKGKFKAL
jgi:DNA-binding MarR family transcriptional regulator